jgi:anti-anti-sigma factor
VSAVDPGETRITVEGELDSASARQLADAFTEAIRRGELEGLDAAQQRPFVRLTLDLQSVGFIDSAGLRMLIVIQREAEEREIPLAVLAPPDSVTQLLELAGVARRVNLVSESEAPAHESAFLERMELELEAGDQAPSQARAAVRESLGPVLAESVLANVVLMTSELVTNGVIHSSEGETVGLRLTRFADAVRVEVDDAGAGFDPAATPPRADHVPDPDTGGRGLFVVDQCATRWGARRADTDRGTRFSVWFELETEAT